MHKQVAATGGATVGIATTGVRATGPEGRLTQTFNDVVEVGQVYRERGISTIVMTLSLEEAVAFRNMLLQRDHVRCVLANLLETAPTPSSGRKNTAEAEVGSPQSQAIAEARELLHKWDLADYCAITRARSASRMQDLYKAAEDAGLDLNSVPPPKNRKSSHDSEPD